jgi:L-ribulose-5-phosphate 3-epimerase
MVKSISFWSFPQGTTVAQAMQMAKDAGFEGIELTVEAEGDITVDSSPEDVKTFRSMADDLELQLPTLATGLGWQFPTCGPDDEVTQRGVDIVRKCLELAAALGAQTILCVPCSVTAEYPYDRACDDVRERFSALGSEAADAGVCIGLENVWNKFLLSPLEFARMIDDIGQQYVQAYFDVGNVMLTGFPDQWIRILGQRIKAVHFKDFRCVGWAGTIDNFVDLLEGNVPWDPVMDAFTEVGYDGPVTAEMMPPYAYHPRRLLEATSRSMDAILGRA